MVRCSTASARTGRAAPVVAAGAPGLASPNSVALRSSCSRNQNTSVGLVMTSIPSLNVTPRTSFGNWLCPVEPSPAFLCTLEQFEDHCERGPVGRAALRSDRAVYPYASGRLALISMLEIAV